MELKTTHQQFIDAINDLGFTLEYDATEEIIIAALNDILDKVDKGWLGAWIIANKFTESCNTKTPPKKIYTYIIDFDGLIKIGKSTNPERRVKDLSSHHLKILNYDFVVGDYEKILHDNFKFNRKHGEYFYNVSYEIIKNKLLSLSATDSNVKDELN